MTEKSEIVRQLPAEHGGAAQNVVARAVARPAQHEQEVRPLEVWGAIRRNRWLILISTSGALAVAALLTSRATPLYQASATLKIEVKEPNLPGIFRSLPDGSELGTEAGVLQSRTLAESAATALSLQFRVIEPRRVSRDELFDSISVTPEAVPTSYQLVRQAGGRYALLADSTGTLLTTIGPGDSLQLAGLKFRLLPGAAAYETIEFKVVPFEQAALGILGKLTVDPAGRDVNILTIGYEDTDPGLVWKVPNAIVDRYLNRRREVARAEARSTVRFLKEQLDTVSAQLADAEDALRGYRERHRAIDPQAEATSQVHRLVSMQSERTSIESERTALSTLLAEVDAKAARQRREDPTSYRELAAFPTLLRSQMATGLLQSLSSVEQQRSELLTRRTANDPDVQALSERVKDLEAQLRSVVVTYLQGLTNQVTTLDASLEQFGQQLGAMPQRELEVARLERKPKVLDEISAMLETRLKEAEIAQAAGDPSIQILDPAAPPRGPFKPNRTANLAAGLLCGLLLGGLTTFVREYRDRTVHTRAEIEVATGLPVLGLIPTIRAPRRSMKRIALITERQKRRPSPSSTASASSSSLTRAHTPTTSTHTPNPSTVHPPSQSTVQPSSARPSSKRSTYTFFTAAPSHDSAGGEPPPLGESPAPESLPREEPIPTVDDLPRLVMQKLALTEAGHAVAEAYGILQTNIAFSFRDRLVRTVVITSALPGEGKTTNAVNLSLSLARRGLRVLLIDADLRRGAVHAAFEAQREPGLTDVLQASVPFARACRGIEIDGYTMHYLTAGAAVSTPTAVLDSDALRALLSRLKEEYDVIIIDSPPANIVTDAAVLGAMADGVILVARSGVTEGGALGSAIDQLRHVRAPLLGVVLNDIDFKRDAAYDATYRYHNYSQYVNSSPS